MAKPRSPADGPQGLLRKRVSGRGRGADAGRDGFMTGNSMVRPHEARKTRRRFLGNTFCLETASICSYLAIERTLLR